MTEIRDRPCWKWPWRTALTDSGNVGTGGSSSPSTSTTPSTPSTRRPATTPSTDTTIMRRPPGSSPGRAAAPTTVRRSTRATTLPLRLATPATKAGSRGTGVALGTRPSSRT